MEKHSYILFDKSPGPGSPRLIEVECGGSGIKCGDWEEQDDGLWRLYLNRLPELTEMEVEIERLQDIVNRLPKTADSVPVIPKVDGAYHANEPCEGVVCDEEDVEFDRTGAGNWHYHLIEDCYSTEEAAKRQRKINDANSEN